MNDLAARTEQRRVVATAATDPGIQRKLGQFFTPQPAAALIASLVRLDELNGKVRILDPGAGSGSLSAAMVARLAAERPDVDVHVVAVEIDRTASHYLAQTLTDCERLPGVTTELVVTDFVESATGLDLDPRVAGPFDVVIMNPPYGKLATSAAHRRALVASGVDAPNIYAAFWALAIQRCRPGGQVVAILPRGWANGSYFEGFREWLLRAMRLDVLHVFESRNAVFADTGVLQENVIVSGTVGVPGGSFVTLSVSVGHSDEVRRQEVSASAVVQPDDPHKFVRFTDGAASVPEGARYTMGDLGLTVSTGRVVDFRARPWLSPELEPGTRPLIYPGNIRAGEVENPRRTGKPQALRISDPDARKLLVPAGVYTLVKRFSAKEERRRVVAAVWERDGVQPAFENHLNYIHENGRGLPVDLARGLSAWLNSTALDQLFRTFSGHTQVNAGDLRTLPYPSRSDLAVLGRAVPSGIPRQETLDEIVRQILSGVREAS